MMSTVIPSRPALRYLGGKWRLAAWILSYCPAHICYGEPFGGGGNVLLRKPEAPVEVYNDLDGNVVNFFRILRERTEELVQAIKFTPYSRQEFDLSYEDVDDDLEQARRFFIRSWQGRSGPSTRWKSGWRFQRVIGSSGRLLAGGWDRTDWLWAVVARLKRVQIEHGEALDVIRRYDAPGTLFYCDPPYVGSTRSQKWREQGYRNEMSDDDHRALAEVLCQVQGMAVLSGYPSALYDDELYSDWQRVTCQARTDYNQARTECLWLSPQTVAALDKPEQLGLFD